MTQKNFADRKIFISYRRTDSAFAVALINIKLLEQFGKDYLFIDSKNIEPGVDFTERLYYEVSQSDVLLAVIGDRWLSAPNELGKRRIDDPKDYVRIEIETAIDLGIRIIPLLLNDIDMPKEKDLPESLKPLSFRNKLPIRAGTDLDNDITSLARELYKCLESDQDIAYKKVLTFALDAAEYEKELEEHWLQNRDGKIEHYRSNSLVRNATNRLPSPKQSVNDVVKYLADWIESESTTSPCCVAILGEFGIGKSTVLRQFAKAILKEQGRGRWQCTPLIFDLRRHFSKNLRLDEIIAACIEGTHSSNDTSLTNKDLIRAVKQGKALPIFDGIDEVIKLLGKREAVEFCKELWKILPSSSALNKGHNGPEERPKSKMILSCRSNIFKEADDHLVLRPDNGLDMTLLTIEPFDWSQIKGYLSCRFGESEGASIYQKMGNIHGLYDVARRPVFLYLLSSIMPQVVQQNRYPNRVNDSDVYETILREHLKTNDPNDVFDIEHKLTLLSELAAILWKSRAQRLTWAEVQNWFDNYLHVNPLFSDRYKQFEREVLYASIRNATLIIRLDSDDHFCFSHTSIQEYFIALWMVQTLEGSLRESLDDISMPSVETLTFFGQLLEKNQDQASNLLAALESAIESSSGSAALIGLQYLRLAEEEHYPKPRPGSWPLREQNMFGWDMDSLTLQNVDFSGACLAETSWRNTTIKGGTFENAMLVRSDWENAFVTDVDFSGAQWNGARLKKESELINCRNLDMPWYSSIRDSIAESCPLLDASIQPSTGVAIPRITSIAIDESTSFYLLGTSSGELVVWDPDNYECVKRLYGHKGPVYKILIDPVMPRYVTMSSDGTVRVWCSSKSVCIKTFKVSDSYSRAKVAIDTSETRYRYLVSSCIGEIEVFDPRYGFRRIKKLRIDATGTAESTIEVSPTVDYLLVDAQKSMYVGVSHEGLVAIWDSNTLDCVATYQSICVGYIRAVEHDVKRSRYLYGSHEGEVAIWNADDHTKLEVDGSTESPWVGSAVSAIAVDDVNNRYIVAEHDEPIATVFCARTLQHQEKLTGHHHYITDIVVDTDHDCYITASDGDMVKVWDMERLRCSSTFHGSPGGLYRRIYFDLQRSHYLFVAADAGSVSVWDADMKLGAGEPCCLAMIKPLRLFATHIEHDPSSSQYFICQSDGSVLVWDCEDDESIKYLPEQEYGICCTTAYEKISEDNKKISYVAIARQNGVVDLICTENVPKRLLNLQENTLNSMCVDEARGWLLISTWNNSIQIWDIEKQTMEDEKELPVRSITALCFDVDNDRYLVGTSDGIVLIFDAAGHDEVGRLEQKSSVHRIYVDRSSQSPRYLSVGQDGSVKVWESNKPNFKCLHTILADKKSSHSERQDVVVSGGGTAYIYNSPLGVATVMDASNFECVKKLNEYAESATCVFMDNKKAQYLVAFVDGSVHVISADDFSCQKILQLMPGREWALLDGKRDQVIKGTTYCHDYLIQVGKDRKSQRQIAIPYGLH